MELRNYAGLVCLVMEGSSVLGGIADFNQRITKKGFTEANKEQRELFGYPDEVREREVTRLKVLKATKGG